MNRFIELTSLYRCATDEEKKLSIKVSGINSFEEIHRHIIPRKDWNESKNNGADYDFYTFDCYDDYYKFMRDVYNKGTEINYNGDVKCVKESYEQVKEMILGVEDER